MPHARLIFETGNGGKINPEIAPIIERELGVGCVMIQENIVEFETSKAITVEDIQRSVRRSSLNQLFSEKPSLEIEITD